MNFLKKSFLIGMSTLMVAGIASADIIPNVSLKLTYQTSGAVNATFANSGTGYWVTKYHLESDVDDGELLSSTAFCVEDVDAIIGISNYDLISLDELDSDFGAKYYDAASIAEGFVSGEGGYTQQAAQAAIWTTVLGSDFTLNSTVYGYTTALNAFDDFDVSNWYVAVSPTGDFSNGVFPEGTIGQNYLVRMDSPSNVPEPTILSLLGLSLLVFAGLSRRKKD